MNKLQWNANQTAKLFIHENASKNIVCEMAAGLSRGGRVRVWLTFLSSPYETSLNESWLRDGTSLFTFEVLSVALIEISPSLGNPQWSSLYKLQVNQSPHAHLKTFIRIRLTPKFMLRVRCVRRNTYHVVGVIGLLVINITFWIWVSDSIVLQEIVVNHTLRLIFMEWTGPL